MDSVKPLKVLLLEEDSSDAAFLNAMLVDLKEECEIVQAKNLREVSSLCTSFHDFDVAILDLALPDKQGVEVVMATREFCHDVPFVVMTPHEDDELGYDAVRLGAQEHLVKSKLTLDILRRAIRHAVLRQKKILSLELARFELESRLQDRATALEHLENVLHHETEQLKTAEENLQQSNRVVQTVMNCSEAVSRIDNETDLMQEICRIIVDLGHYKMSWAGVPENDPDKTIRPVASAGAGQVFLNSIHVTWAEGLLGGGPTAKAIRTGQTQICQDVNTDPDMVPWREPAARFGIRSGISLPLKAHDQLLGVLVIYSEKPGDFDQEQVAVLHLLVNYLAVGLLALRGREEKTKIPVAI